MFPLRLVLLLLPFVPRATSLRLVEFALTPQFANNGFGNSGVDTVCTNYIATTIRETAETCLREAPVPCSSGYIGFSSSTCSSSDENTSEETDQITLRGGVFDDEPYDNVLDVCLAYTLESAACLELLQAALPGLTSIAHSNVATPAPIKIDEPTKSPLAATVTESPTTVAPVSVAPITDAPTTAAPVTEAPTRATVLVSPTISPMTGTPVDRPTATPTTSPSIAPVVVATTTPTSASTARTFAPTPTTSTTATLPPTTSPTQAPVTNILPVDVPTATTVAPTSLRFRPSAAPVRAEDPNSDDTPSPATTTTETEDEKSSGGGKFQVRPKVILASALGTSAFLLLMIVIVAWCCCGGVAALCCCGSDRDRRNKNKLHPTASGSTQSSPDDDDHDVELGGPAKTKALHTSNTSNHTHNKKGVVNTLEALDVFPGEETQNHGTETDRWGRSRQGRRFPFSQRRGSAAHEDTTENSSSSGNRTTSATSIFTGIVGSDGGIGNHNNDNENDANKSKTTTDICVIPPNLTSDVPEEDSLASGSSCSFTMGGRDSLYTAESNDSATDCVVSLLDDPQHGKSNGKGIINGSNVGQEDYYRHHSDIDDDNRSTQSSVSSMTSLGFDGKKERERQRKMVEWLNNSNVIPDASKESLIQSAIQEGIIEHSSVE